MDDLAQPEIDIASKISVTVVTLKETKEWMQDRMKSETR